MRRSFFTVPILSASLLGLAGHTASAADLIAYEGFNYSPVISLAGLNGGSGWNAAWILAQEIPTGVGSPGLSWPNLETSGNTAVTAAYPSTAYSMYVRVLAPYSAPDAEVFVSFLFQPMPGYGQGGGLQFGTVMNGMIVGAHPGTFHYGLTDMQFAGVDTLVPVQLNVTALCVARITNNLDGTITYDMWVNPPLGSSPPGPPEASYSQTGTLPAVVRILNDGGFLTDEIRIGKTWASVLPSTLPPPCTGDVNGSGTVDAADLAILLGAWGGVGGDVNGNGTTDATDLGLLLGGWGPCP